MKINEYGNIKIDKDLPEFYPLFRAVRWIAFGEWPVDPILAEVLYSKILLSNEEWIRYDNAKRSLQAELLIGSIKAYSSLSSTVDINGRTKFYPTFTYENGELQARNSEPVVIKSDRWVASRSVDWLNNKLYTYDLDYNEIQYMNISVNTYNLLAKFPAYETSVSEDVKLPPTKPVKNPRGAGRKEKFDWEHKLYPEIMRFLHFNGASDNVSAMAARILDNYALKYIEDPLPDLDTVRKRITPILARIREN